MKQTFIGFCWDKTQFTKNIAEHLKVKKQFVQRWHNIYKLHYLTMERLFNLTSNVGFLHLLKGKIKALLWIKRENASKNKQ